MQKSQRVLMLLIAFMLSVTCSQAADSLIDTETRLAIVGDSITEQRIYSRYMDMYLIACQPVKLESIMQYGWSGDTAPGFEKRMKHDLLDGFKPTLMTTAYGMNDGGYRQFNEGIGKRYRDGMDSILKQAKDAGVTVLTGGPGCVDTFTFKRDTATPAVYNENLGELSKIAAELAEKYGFPFADVHNTCMQAMAKAKAELGEKYPVMGNDGFHPGDNGQLAMAYAFLKEMGLTGEIGTISVDLAATPDVKVSTGHRVVEIKDDGFMLESKIYPFCFTGNDGGSNTRTMARFMQFNQDLNRFILIVTNLDADNATISWGQVSKDFSKDELEKGINLADVFAGDTPFQTAWNKLNQAVSRKQEYERWLIKNYRTDLRTLNRYVSVDSELYKDYSSSWDDAIKLQQELYNKAVDTVTPVTHMIKITPKK